MRKLHNFREAKNGVVVSAIYGKFEDSDKNYNLQIMGLNHDNMHKIKSFVMNNKNMFLQGWDPVSTSTWVMVEFWTDDLDIIEKSCDEIINLVGVKKEDVQGWEHPDFDNVFGDVS